MPYNLVICSQAQTTQHSRRLIRTGGPVLAAFLIGAVGMVFGAVVGCAVMGPWMCAGLGADSGSNMYQATCVAASLCSSYVGGSINFVAVSQVCTGLYEDWPTDL